MARRSGHHRTITTRGLTERQKDVLEQVALGKTNFEIGEALGISFESVKSHVSEILLRLDVSSREEAAAAWRADQGGVLSRLRRTATGFVMTGIGKAATAGVAVLAAAGVTAAALFAGDDPGPTASEGEPFVARPTATQVVLPPQPFASRLSRLTSEDVALRIIEVFAASGE